MHRPLRELRRIQRYAATLLIALMFYQFGACPCGCLEHSAWAQMLGVDASGDEVQDALGTHRRDRAVVARGHDEHDCTGNARPKYLNNARPSSVERILGADRSLASVVVSDLTARSADAVLGRCRIGPTFDATAAPCRVAQRRAALQVFLL